MVDESGVEAAAVSVGHTFAASRAAGRLWNINGFANVEHPEFGMVTVRFKATPVVDSRRPIEKQESDFRTLIERCVKSIEEAARAA